MKNCKGNEAGKEVLMNVLLMLSQNYKNRPRKYFTKCRLVILGEAEVNERKSRAITF